MNHIQREILKLAVELYEEALASGEHFAVADLAERLTEVLLSRFADEGSVVRDLIESVAQSTMRTVDKERTRADTQASLLDDLDRPIPVGESKRIARRAMRQGDWSVHLANVSDNASRVAAAASTEYTRHAALSPYLSAGMDTEAAVRAWQADHPDEVLP